MKPVVAILAQGGMGAAIGARLVTNGVVVKTPLAGRSAASVERAMAAGMQDASLAEIAECDIVLSIVPPADALAVAEKLAPSLSTSGGQAVYVDCNAVNPETLRQIAAVIGKTGCNFVDSGIIGLPPKTGGGSPKFFACGEGLPAFQTLSAFGLDIRPVDGPVGAASTLKMCYGGITKGVIAVGAAMILAASRSGVAKELFDELSASQATLVGSFAKSLPDMLPKAGRWVAEMQEISAFVGDQSAEGAVYAAFADFYRRQSKTDAGAHEQTRMISSFFSPVR